VLSTGAPTPNRTISGKELQALHDPEAQIQRFYIGPVSSQRGQGIVLSWRTEDGLIEEFVSELRSLSPAVVPGILVQFMFAHIENTFFSSSWWSSLSSPQRQHITQLAIMGNPYYTVWRYRDDFVLPWAQLEIVEEW
jgi:hypothetical protein